jgi:hypothetical protein
MASASFITHQTDASDALVCVEVLLIHAVECTQSRRVRKARRPTYGRLVS